MAMKKLFYIYLMAAMAAVVSCSKEPEKIMVDGPAVLGLTAEGISDEIVILEPKTLQLDVRVKAETVSEEPLLVAIKADESLVEAYNSANGTSYKMPPAGAYYVPKDKLILAGYNTTSSTSRVSLISTGLTDTDTYLLPLTISEVSGKGDVIKSEKSSTLYITYRKRVLPTPLNLSKTGWNLVYCSSEYPENYAAHKFVRSDDPSSTVTGYARDIIDGDYASVWAYDWKTPHRPPFYIVVDFGREVTVRGLDLWAMRGNKDMMNPNNTAPSGQCGQCTVEFATAISGTGMDDKNGGVSDWGYSEAFGPDILKNQIKNTVYLTEIIRARYMRFTYEAGYKNTTDVNLSNYAGGRLAEIDALGHEEELELD